MTEKSLSVKLGKRCFTLSGVSVAGFKTSITIEQLKLCFDCGAVFDKTLNCDLVLVSHCHYDHMGALLEHCFSRRLRNLTTPTYIFPKESIDQFNIVHDQTKLLNKGLSNDSPHDWLSRQYTPLDVDHKSITTLKPKLGVQAFSTIHRVTSQAYIVYDFQKKLKAEYRNFDNNQIKDLVKQKVNVCQENWQSLIAYTGDTTIEGVLQHDELLKCPILIIECTYLLEDSPLDSQMQFASNRAHIHENNIKDNISKFQNEQIVLTHLSAKYSDVQKCDAVQRLHEAAKTLDLNLKFTWF